MAKRKADTTTEAAAGPSVATSSQPAEEPAQPVNKNKRFRKDKRECRADSHRSLDFRSLIELACHSNAPSSE